MVCLMSCSDCLVSVTEGEQNLRIQSAFGIGLILITVVKVMYIMEAVFHQSVLYPVYSILSVKVCVRFLTGLDTEIS